MSDDAQPSIIHHVSDAQPGILAWSRCHVIIVFFCFHSLGTGGTRLG